MSAISSGVTSGRAGRGEETTGRLLRSGITRDGRLRSSTRLVNFGSKISAFPPVFVNRSRMIGMLQFALRTSIINPARARP